MSVPLKETQVVQEIKSKITAFAQGKGNNFQFKLSGGWKNLGSTVVTLLFALVLNLYTTLDCNQIAIYCGEFHARLRGLEA